MQEYAQLPDFANAHQGLIDGSLADEGQNGWSIMAEDVSVDDQVCFASHLAAMHPFLCYIYYINQLARATLSRAC